MQQLTEEQRAKLDAISRALGVSLFTLLENKTAETVIQEYNNGQLKVLND